MKIINIEDCKIEVRDDILHLEKGNSSKPLYKLFRNYVGMWVKLNILETSPPEYEDYKSNDIKFKVLSVNCNGEIIGEYKWRKRKHHAWKYERFNVVDIFNRYNQERAEPTYNLIGEKIKPWPTSIVNIKLNPNVTETGGKDLDTLIYRIEHTTSKAGMWYNLDGTYNGIIHELSDGKSKNIPMPLTENHLKDNKNWYSGTRSLDELLKWFSKLDIKELVDKGYGVFRIRCTDYIRCENEILFTRESVTEKTPIQLGSIAQLK